MMKLIRNHCLVDCAIKEYFTNDCPCKKLFHRDVNIAACFLKQVLLRCVQRAVSRAARHESNRSTMGLVEFLKVECKGVRRRHHTVQRAYGRLTSLNGRTPPRALGVPDLSGDLLLLEIIDRQHDNISTDTQSDHGRQAQRLAFWLHKDALFFQASGRKNPANVAKFGHSFPNEQRTAAHTIHCC